MKRIVFAAVLVIAAGLLTSCYEIHDKKIVFGPDFGPKDDKNQVIDNLDFVAGQTVTWCNTSSFTLIVVTDDRGMFGGRTSIRLAPGECINLRVLRGSGKFAIEWTYLGEDGNIEGGGGTPGKRDCPPAPQPC